MVSINNTITMIGEGNCQSCTFPTTTTPKFYDPLVHHLLLREKDIQPMASRRNMYKSSPRPIHTRRRENWHIVFSLSLSLILHRERCAHPLGGADDDEVQKWVLLDPAFLLHDDEKSSMERNNIVSLTAFYIHGIRLYTRTRSLFHRALLVLKLQILAEDRFGTQRVYPLFCTRLEPIE